MLGVDVDVLVGDAQVVHHAGGGGESVDPSDVVHISASDEGGDEGSPVECDGGKGGRGEVGNEKGVNGGAAGGEGRRKEASEMEHGRRRRRRKDLLRRSPVSNLKLV